MNFASVRRLPVLFVCENNLYSVHSPLRVRQPEGRPIRRIGTGHGVDGATGDGNDVIEVWQMVGEAIKRMRSGNGPALLEFTTYRWVEHCGPNDDVDLGYRSASELADWKSRCPVMASERALRADGLLDDAALSTAIRQIDEEIEEAFAAARSSPFPAPGTLAEFVVPI
jgi:pyruvate dehydrogenase E1 component alpha subunit